MSVYILGGTRTPSGSFLGSLSRIKATELGSVAIRGAIEKSGISPKEISQVYMGMVVQAGAGQAPARQAALFSGLPESVSSTTVNKVCGSGMMATILAAQGIETGFADLAIAGGMENMSMAPHILSIREGVKFGNTQAKDAMQWDGLWDVYSDRPMGNCAEECVAKYEFTREQQDEFAIKSFKKAQRAVESKIFESEITPVLVKGRKGEVLISQDEGPFKVNYEKLPKLRPAFEKNGTITAANASTINDGAAALVLGGEKYRDKAKFRIIGFASHAQSPTWFTTAPIEAIKKNLEKVNLTLSDIDLFEINEAFAVVTMVTVKELGIPEEKVNIYGGGVSLGHPIGCSGARILVTLMNALEREDKRYGLGAICIGGGEALSIIIERI